jgi:pimeloyl-ACP methyl ester carboxylesterase
VPELTFQQRRVAYLEQGTGPLLVLLHAGGSSSKQWTRMASLLDEQFRIALILIEPVLMPLLRLVGEDRVFREWADIADTFMSHAAAGRAQEAWRAFIDYRNGPGAWQALPAAAQARFVAATASTVAGFHSNLNNPTTLADLDEVRLPTLVMCGEKTTTPDRRVTEILRDRIPRCRYLVIPGADHMSPLTHAEPIAQAIRRHVDEAPDEVIR